MFPKSEQTNQSIRSQPSLSCQVLIHGKEIVTGENSNKMSNAMNPSAPSQPSINSSYSTAGNPIDHSRQEVEEAASKATSNEGSVTEQRMNGDLPVPSQHAESGTPTSLAYGTRSTAGDNGEEVRSPTHHRSHSLFRSRAIFYSGTAPFNPSGCCDKPVLIRDSRR